MSFSRLKHPCLTVGLLNGGPGLFHTYQGMIGASLHALGVGIQSKQKLFDEEPIGVSGHDTTHLRTYIFSVL